MNDDPAPLAQVAQSMAAYGTGTTLAPWWSVGASVDALVQVAAGDGELAEPARVALQIMASVYNKKVRST